MRPCLAATGSDPTLFIVFAAGLLVLGAVIAVVAIRRGKAGAALLILALPFLVGAPILSSAAPATAQVGVPCPTPTPTPTPTCEPADPVPGITVEGSDWFLNDSGTGYQSTFTEADFVALDAVEDAISAIDPDFTSTLTAAGQSGATMLGPVTLLDGDYEIDEVGYVLFLEESVFEGLIGTNQIGSVWFEFTVVYDDGCGGTLTTIVRMAGDFDFEPVP